MGSGVDYALGALSGVLQGIDQIAQRRKAEQLQAISILGQQPGAVVGPAQEARPANFLQRLLGTLYQPTESGAPVVSFGGIPITVNQEPNPIAALLAGGGGTGGAAALTPEAYTQTLLQEDLRATAPRDALPLQEQDRLAQSSTARTRTADAKAPLDIRTLTPGEQQVAQFLGASEAEMLHPVMRAALANPRSRTPQGLFQALDDTRKSAATLESQQALREQRLFARENQRVARQNAALEQSRKIAEDIASLLYDVETPEDHANAIAGMRDLGTIPEEYIRSIETFDPARNRRLVAAATDVKTKAQLEEARARRLDAQARTRQTDVEQSARIDERRQERLAAAHGRFAQSWQTAVDNAREDPAKLAQLHELRKQVNTYEDPGDVLKAIADIPIGRLDAGLLRDREKARIEAQAKIEEAPLDAGDKAALSDLNRVIRALNEVGKLYEPGFVGRINGPTGQVRVFTGTAENAEVQFRLLLKDIQDLLLRERSMSSTTEQEFQRLKNIVPNPNMPVGSFYPAFQAFARSTEAARDEILDFATASRARIKETAPRVEFRTELPPATATSGLPRRNPSAPQTAAPPAQQQGAVAPQTPQITPAQAESYYKAILARPDGQQRLRAFLQSQGLPDTATQTEAVRAIQRYLTTQTP